MAALAGLGTAGLLASCTPGAGTTATPVAPGLPGITFAAGQVDINTYLLPLVDEWNRAHPKPADKVTVIPLPKDSDDQHAQLVANLQTRSSLYDVMDLDVVWTAEFAANGWIVPLNTKQVPLKEFLPPAVATAQYAGRTWAVPFTSNAGLLFYRSDILRAARVKPPSTWAQLISLARKLAPMYHMAGYAGQLKLYEGLTVNFAEAVQSAGGSILSPGGTKVTLDSPDVAPYARAGLQFLLSGLKEGWIPKAALKWDETASAERFMAGKLLFMRNWPYIYGEAATRGPHNKVAGNFNVVVLPGLNGPGSSVLGGSNLAISAYSRHQKTALAFINFLTKLSSEEKVLQTSAMPPVWNSLYTNPALKKKFPYLHALEQAILLARPRPQIPSYGQFSLTISSTIHHAMEEAAHGVSVSAGSVIANLAGQLRQFMRSGA